MTNPVLINTKLGEAKGKPRIWMEGAHLLRAGIKPGQTLKIRFLGESGTVEGSPGFDDDVSDHEVRVSKRTDRNGREKALLEIRHEKLLELFGENARLRVVVRDGKFVIRLLHIDQKVHERISRVTEKLMNEEPLTIGSLFHGGGTLDNAFHEGMDRAGIKSTTKVVNEIDSKFLSSSIQNNRHLFNEDTLFINAPIETIDFSKGCEVDIVLAGVPCTGASLSGRASKKLKFAESHETAGALFFSFLQFVQNSNPLVCILENVKQYEGTASYAVILNVLETLGYNIQDAILKGDDFGALEARERLFMIATTKGMPEIDFDALIKPEKVYKTAEEALDDVPLDSELWRTFPYLDEAEAKAKSKGNGFKRSYVTMDSETTPTIKRTNHKCQTDGVFIQHPSNPDLSRLPSMGEHARFKSVPESLIEGISATAACEILGQGIIHNVAVSVGEGLAHQCLRPLVLGNNVLMAA